MHKRNGNVVDLDAYRAAKKREQLTGAKGATEHELVFGLFWPEHLPFTSPDTMRERDEPPKY